MTNSSAGTGDVSRFHSNLKRGFAASASILAISLLAQPVQAQTAEGEDTIVVTGSRQLNQDAIALKRANTQIVDGLSADEIGDIPALSIGEALETITGVASHRENGGATEVSIRGLGPFLSSTVVNGRVATNGSGDRSVNFSQFPSELVNKLEVFKTQSASQIEGGVAGQIQIETLKPLDFGKQRIQAEIKGNINPDQLNQSDTEAGDIGYRGTFSYVDQYEINGLGEIGISVGAQRSDISQPEAEFRSTSGLPPFNSRPACVISDGLAQFTDQTNGGTFTGFSNNPETTDRGDDDCDDFNDRRNAENLDTRGSDTEGFDTSLDADGNRIDGDTPFAIAPSQRGFRQNDTRDERDAIFGGLQWAPNDRLELNFDVQWSERTQSEIRNDLTFNGGRRNDTNLDLGVLGETTTLDSLVLTPQGGILRGITQNTIEIGGGDFEREETYTGFGFAAEYDVTDKLTVSADYGFSNTERTESAVEFRIQSDIQPVIEFDQRDRDVPIFNLFGTEFDVTDRTNFVDRLRLRIDNDVFRDNTVNSLRFDADYEVGGSFFTNLKAGVRWAEQDYLELPGGGGGLDTGNPLLANTGRLSFEIENDGELTVQGAEILDDRDEGSNDPAFAQQQALQADLVSIIGATNEACFQEFQESSFFSSLRDDENLITNIGPDGNVLSSVNSFATFDAACVGETAVNSLNGILDQINAFSLNPDATENSFGAAINPFTTDIPELSEINIRTIDVQEETRAIYAQADYESSLGEFPVSGNVGLRVVQTDVTATGYRPQLTVTENDGEFTLQIGDELEAFQLEHDYTEFLPSAIAVVELSDDKLLRFGAFRSLSRADPSDLGLGRQFQTSADDSGEDTAESLDELITGVTAFGNPAIDPLTAWNFDAGFEWYPNRDSILAISGYYKSFRGGFTNVTENETFSINGQDVSFDVSGLQQVSDDSSDLFGVEFTGSHQFSYLPGILSGLGVKVSYNYVDSDFEFEDSRFGDVFQGLADGTVIQTNEGIVAPGGLPGLSDHTLSAQVYHQVGKLDTSIRYKFRSEYFQPFTSDGTRLRFVDDVGVWEARASYKLTDNFRLSAEAINIFSEPRNDAILVNDDRFQINDFGPRIFFGLRGRF